MYRYRQLYLVFFVCVLVSGCATQTAPIELATVVMAKEDIKVGSEIEDSMVEERDFVYGTFPEECIWGIEDVRDREVVAPIYEGEMIHRDQLRTPGTEPPLDTSGSSDLFMSPGMEITAKFSNETVCIRSIGEMIREYEIKGVCRRAKMERDYSGAAYSSDWLMSFDNIPAEGVCFVKRMFNQTFYGDSAEEQLNFSSKKQFLNWLFLEAEEECIYRNDGLTVQYQHDESSASVRVSQIYINGSKPDTLPGSQDNRISISKSTAQTTKVRLNPCVWENRERRNLRIDIRAIRRSPDSESFTSRARILNGLGHCEEALKSCDMARKFSPVCDYLDSIKSSTLRRVRLEQELAETEVQPDKKSNKAFAVRTFP